MGKVSEIATIEEFNRVIASKAALVDFTATWCGPCRALAPILEQMARDNPSIQVVKVDIDKHPQLASQQQVTSVPMVAWFREGKRVDSFVGARDARFLQQFIDRCGKQ